MSDEAPSVPEKREMPGWVKMAVVASIGVVLLAGVQWAGGVRAEVVRRETFARGIDALAGAMTQSVLEGEKSKLQTTVERIATQSGYEKVTVLNLEGVVLASTDRIHPTTGDAQITNPPLKTEVKSLPGQLVATRAVVLAGDTRVGSIQVVVAP